MTSASFPCRIRAIGLAFVLLQLATAWHDAAAQTPRASVRGLVSDRSGSPVARAVVSVTDVSTSSTRSVHADDEGRFVVSLLPPGTHRLRVEARGYRTYEAELPLVVNQQRRADVLLEVGTGNRTVTVPAALRSETMASGTVIE